jgi:5-formyltetrahydrofolate cyclo-ligase
MPDRNEITAAKQAVRERVWDALTAAGAARFPGARGRIPNFTGAERAAERLALRPEWQAAAALKSNPDLPQLPVRALALAEGRRLYLAVPRLTAALPFLLLDPEAPDVGGARPRQAASIKGAARVGRPTAVADLPHLDLVVCGSVAVNRDGARVGKGGGFSDLELALAIQAGKVDDRTVVVTTVHPVQLLDEDLPETGHDFRVDLVVTPDEVVECRQRRRPPGVLWEDLDDEKIAAVPALAAQRGGRAGQ